MLVIINIFLTFKIILFKLVFQISAILSCRLMYLLNLFSCFSSLSLPTPSHFSLSPSDVFVEETELVVL